MRRPFFLMLAVCAGALLGALTGGLDAQPPPFGCGSGMECYSVPDGCGVGVGCMRVFCYMDECPAVMGGEYCFYCVNPE
jgi:hypothetical protein